jgi:hypothetical protein
MAYAKLSSTNNTYQARDNFIQFINDNKSNKDISFYYIMPDLTSYNWSGFPFILLPDSDDKIAQQFGANSVYEFENTIIGEIVHAKDKLGDNKLRILRQDLINMFTNKLKLIILQGYGLHNVKIDFDPNQPESQLLQGKELITIQFHITYNVNLDMGGY